MNQTEKIQASAFIICCNEERHIRRALQSLRDFAEVVVVDSGSTDATMDILSQFDCRVIHHEWTGYAAQKRYAASMCQFDWVLNLDADEELTPELRDEIALLVRDPGDVAGLHIPFAEVFLGQPANRWTKQHRRVRCFRRSLSSYPEKLVHEHVDLHGERKEAVGQIRHYGEYSISVKVEKNNRYSDLRAAEKAAAGKRPSIVRLVTALPLTFLKSYFLRRSFLNGWRGFAGSLINAFYAFMKEAKLFELTTVGSPSGEKPQP